MKRITSRDNPFYKEIKQLAQSPQARRKASRTLLDGVHLCEAYLDCKGFPLVCLASEEQTQSPEIAKILQRCQSGGLAPVVVPDALYRPLSQVETGVGILFLVATPEGVPQRQLKESAVILDRLQDPGNLGSILRTAAAAGISHVLCSPDTVHAWSPKVVRAGMSAHFLLNIVENVPLEPLLKNATIPVIATSSHASQSLYELDLNRPVAWLFGHEGQGVAPHLLAMADESAAIPHAGRIESLNVAASVAVCLFEQLRQRKA